MTFAEQLKPSVGALKAAKKCMLALPCGDLPKSNPVPIIERWAAHIDREAVNPAVAELVNHLADYVSWGSKHWEKGWLEMERLEGRPCAGLTRLRQSRDLIAKHST